MSTDTLPPAGMLSPEQAVEPSAEKHDFLLVGIGASAGGIKALKEFFAAMPADNGMAFVVILHLSQEHESHLAQILQANTAMVVTQVTETVKVEPNNVYVIPPAKGLAMIDGHIKLTEPERIRGKRVPIDLFFRTLADAYGKNGIAVVLSGTGSDGTLGLKRVKENGGVGIAQEPAEAEYDGMPQSAINTGLVDLILPVGEMPARIIGFWENGHKLRLPPAKDEIPLPQKDKKPDALNEILAIVRVRTGHDFSNYKHATVLRRIARRLQVYGLAGMPEYLTFLREHAEEAEALQRDLLISVTNFFRDREAFDALEKEVIPKLFAGKTSADTIRVWSVGCATGEEAYSLAIFLDEFASRITNAPAVQIFASDINEQAIAAARDCFYDDPIVADVSPERLRHYFTKENGGYRVRKELRETVLFAPHNILRDPPFSKLDLIVCRNLLIYFSRETQEKVLQIFNFALRRDGFLFLGASESAESVSALFAIADKKHRLYQARPSAHVQALPIMPERGKWNIRIPQLPLEPNDKPPVSYGEIHYKLVEQFAPPSVLVNDEREIVHVSENAGRFLRVAGGSPTRDLLSLVHPALKLDLQSALFEAKKDGFVSESRNVRFEADGKETLVSITIRFVQATDAADCCYLVIFDESKSEAAPEAEKQTPETVGGRSAIDNMVRQLENELKISRDRLRATIEQNETSHEELKASNEELQAINEELRSASEELETSKEELQSLNEELLTVNAELKDKVDETVRVNSDLQNLIASTDIGTIFLDRSLRIKRFTPRVAELFNIIASDVGRPLEHLTHQLDYDHLTEDAAEVLNTLRLKEREVRGGAGDNRYLVRLAPYRTLDDKIDGVVLSFQDITDLKRAGDALDESEIKYRKLFDSMDEGYCTIEMLFDDAGKAHDWRFLQVNPAFEKHNGLEQATGKTIRELVPNIEPKWAEIYGKVAVTGEAIRFVEYSAALQRWFDLYAFRIGKPEERKVAVLFNNITERKRSEEALRASEEKFRILSEAAPALIWFDDADGNCRYVNQKYLDFSGRTLDELAGTGWRLFLHPEDEAAYVAEFLAAQREQVAFHQRVRAQRHDGAWRWLESFAQPLFAADGAFLGHVGVSPDITASVEAEQALKDADRRKDEFLATLAHELRNPLAAISPAVVVLQHSENEQNKPPLQVIERQLKQIVRLVDDLLDMGRISQGKIKLLLEPVALSTVIETALETARPLAAAAQHKLTVTLPPEPLYFQADATRLAQVFLNLLTNAIRYTDPGGQITLTAERADGPTGGPTGAQAVVRIKDTGRGIASELLPHIFDLFTQGAQAGQTAQSGLGIGLSLAKKLTELHGGVLAAYSAGPGQGSEFTVRLPLATPAQLEQAASPAQPQDAPPPADSKTPRRILVVDDNVDSAEMLETVLTMDGHEIRLAYDGETALQIALEFQPDLIFLDLGLPDMYGTEVAERLRPQLPDALLVALSGWGQEADRQRTHEAGFDYHLVKPLDFDRLPELLAAAGQKHRSAQSR